MTSEVSADVGARAVSASTGTRESTSGSVATPPTADLAGRMASAVASRDPALVDAIARAVDLAVARNPAAAGLSSRAVAAQIAQDALDQYLVDRILSCEPGSQRNRAHVRQLWNVGFKDVAGNSTTYFQGETAEREIARGELTGLELRGSGWIDLEADGDFEVANPEPGLTITFSLQTSPLPYAAPEVWTTVASWDVLAAASLFGGGAPRRFHTRARLRAHGNTGTVQKHTLTAWTYNDPVTDPPGPIEFVRYTGDLAVPWDTRWSSALRLVWKMDGVPSASRRVTLFGSFANLWPRDPDGD